MKWCRNERGLTMLELLVVLTLAGILLVTTLTFALSWISRESMRGAVYDVQTFLQLARAEAIGRNQDCRFVIDTAAGRLWVMDSMDTSTRTDDVVIEQRRLPSDVRIERPDVGSPVTFTQIGTTDSYEVVFDPDGIVESGAGEAVLFGGDRYGKISVYSAGGVHVERWNGSG
ncbi:MAG: GspH/FimT family pseudopilin, partial [Acidobacteriota bacterium]|nr:GspH/FimT family pseudopilin [Acidobacteriota bacterium]